MVGWCHHGMLGCIRAWLRLVVWAESKTTSVGANYRRPSYIINKPYWSGSLSTSIIFCCASMIFCLDCAIVGGVKAEIAHLRHVELIQLILGGNNTSCIGWLVILLLSNVTRSSFRTPVFLELYMSSDTQPFCSVSKSTSNMVQPSCWRNAGFDSARSRYFKLIIKPCPRQSFTLFVILRLPLQIHSRFLLFSYSSWHIENSSMRYFRSECQSAVKVGMLADCDNIKYSCGKAQENPP